MDEFRKHSVTNAAFTDLIFEPVGAVTIINVNKTNSLILTLHTWEQFIHDNKVLILFLFHLLLLFIYVICFITSIRVFYSFISYIYFKVLLLYYE